jgi:8-oxo-dGTP diphosphatase
MEKARLVVTAALIEKNGTYLITQRPADKHNGGRWEFPGGKVDFGEDLRDCLARELEEELNIKADVGEAFEYSSHVYEQKKHVILLCFRCTYISGEIKKDDVADYAWVIPEEMKDYDITEADQPFIEKLIRLS